MTASVPIFAKLDTTLTPPRLRISGEWTLPHHALLERELLGLREQVNVQTAVELDGISEPPKARGSGLRRNVAGKVRRIPG